VPITLLSISIFRKMIGRPLIFSYHPYTLNYERWEREEKQSVCGV